MLKAVELFAGIGACSKALTNLGTDYEIVDAVEIDKYAIKSFNAIHGTNFKPQDICKWDKDTEVDLIMHGSPCQDFSIAGKQAGGDAGTGTRSSLMYETLRIVEKLIPKYVIWENVPNILSAKHKHNFDAYLSAMEHLGYANHYAVLNAKDFGVPQNRKRVYTVSIFNPIVDDFKFPEAEPLTKKLADVLESEVDEKYYLSDEQTSKFKVREVSQTVRSSGRGSLDRHAWDIIKVDDLDIKGVAIKTATKKGYDDATTGDCVNLAYPESKTRRGRVGHSVAQTLTTSDNMGVIESTIIDDTQGFDGVRKYSEYAPTLRSSRSGLKTVDSHFRIRKLTPKECWRLMGFDDEDFEKASRVNSNTQLYKQAGNSIVVDVLEGILSNLLEKR